MLRIPRVGVHGNHDPSDLLEELEVEDLHGRRTSLGGLPWRASRAACSYGRGGPHQYTQRQATKLARKLPAADVLIAHCPPAGVNDDPEDPAHVGYEGLRDWVDRHRPAPRPARPRPPAAGHGRRARRRHPGALGAGREGAAARLAGRAGVQVRPSTRPPRPFQAKFISTSATRSTGSSGCSPHQTASDSPAPISARASWLGDARARRCRGPRPRRRGAAARPTSAASSRRTSAPSAANGPVPWVTSPSRIAHESRSRSTNVKTASRPCQSCWSGAALGVHAVAQRRRAAARGRAAMHAR